MATKKPIKVAYRLSEMLGCKREMVEWFDDSEVFPDSEYLVVTGMRIFIGKFYGYTVNAGVEVFYNNGKSVLHGDAGYGMEIYELHLAAGERINNAIIQHGGLIDSLLFKTNRGNTFGPYGVPGHATTVLDPPETTGYLAYVKGSIDRGGQWEGNCIRNLQLVWAVDKEQDN